MHFYELLDGFKIKCIGAYRSNDCSNADCDENMSLAEGEWLNLNISYLKDKAWVELKEIYMKLRNSLSKEDKNNNKSLIKFSSRLKQLNHGQ